MNKQQLFETIYEPTIINGYTWQFVGDGWLDVTSGLVWLEEERKEYTYDEAMSLFCSKDKRLPTKEEYIEAEKHGVRRVIGFIGYYWTSSVLPSVSNFACYFYGDNGYVVNAGFRFYDISVRCVREIQEVGKYE